MHAAELQRVGQVFARDAQLVDTAGRSSRAPVGREFLADDVVAREEVEGERAVGVGEGARLGAVGKAVVVNVNEDEAANGNEYSARVFEKAFADGAEAVIVSAAIEADLVTMDMDERLVFLEEMGLHETGLARVIRAGYELLHLITFFTVGPKEARAWTVAKGSRAPQAAGEIHTDFERGFIRAETIAYADYVALNGEAGARDAGKLRQEGKDYVVKDGDVLHFKFNV